MACVYGGWKTYDAKCDLAYEGPLCPVTPSCHDTNPLGSPNYCKDEKLLEAYVCSGTGGTCRYPNEALADSRCGNVKGKRPCVWHKSYDGDNYCDKANREPDLDQYTCKYSCK